MTTPNVMVTPKSFWAIKRNEGHNDWTFGFWRELFQNAVDAGASRIDITVSNADGKGCFGRDPTSARVVRIGFADDGHGMEEDIIRDVFLQPGASTKRGQSGTVGGFGTARVMLCFSQVRYGVRSHGSIVEGDGSEYTISSMDDTITAKRREIAAAEASANPRVSALRAELAELQAQPASVKGCRFEIDLDPTERCPSYSGRISTDEMLRKLDDYLGMSQIPCKISVNGEEKFSRALRGPVRRNLVSSIDGVEVTFARVHTSQGERAKHKNKVIVRVDGATMFTSYTSANTQVIVEIDKDKARRVLLESRDSMKAPFSNVLASFVEELVVDSVSAMKDKDKRKHIEVKGGRGKLEARAPDGGRQPQSEVAPDFSRLAVGAGERTTKLPKARYSSAEEYEAIGFGGVPRAFVDSLLVAIRNGEDTFLTDIAAREPNGGVKVAAFVDAVRNGEGPSALRELPDGAAAELASELDNRVRAAEARRYADLNDIHIQIDDLGDDENSGKLKNALRRHSPAYWRRKGEHLEGRGMEAHMLLAVWQAFVEESLRAALTIDPKLEGGTVKWAVGWYFGKSEERWSGNNYGKVRTAAQHQKRNDTHIFLLNPVSENGQSAYDLTIDVQDRAAVDGEPALLEGLRSLEAKAKHEGAHIFGDRHDEAYSSFLTQIDSLFNSARARSNARLYVDAVREAYGRGKSRIQAMTPTADIVVLDAELPATPKERKIRPAERLLAHVAPVAMAAIGFALADENINVAAADDVRDAFISAIIPASDGTIVVDCDALLTLEAAISVSVSKGWDAPMDMDFAAEAEPALLELMLPDVAVFADPLPANRGPDVEMPLETVPKRLAESSSKGADELPAKAALAVAADPLAALVGVRFMIDELPAAPEAISDVALPAKVGFADTLLGMDFDMSDFGEEPIQAMLF